jgi:GntR family transcriptional regulator/MocR family aminotransferase
MFPRRMWERAAGRALSRAADAELDYGTGHGAPALCDALAGYLGRVRGTAADPGTIVVCGGYIQATTLLFAVLAARGLRRIAFEDPSLDDHWRSAARAGLEAVPVGVDGEGLRVDELAATDAQAVLVTPNHQFPTGAVMGADRRRALLAWAREGERLIIEDDYDAEFRYDRRPLPALQGLDPGRVVYVGTASKTLAPGVRLGWMLAPRELAEELAAEKLLSDGGSATLSQLTLAELIASGELAAHLRRVRTTYARRRARLADALAAAIPSARVEGAAAGVHLVLRLPAALDEQRLRQAMAEHGVAARLIGAPATRLVLGYGRLSTEGIGAAVGALAAAIGDAS